MADYWNEPLTLPIRLRRHHKGRQLETLRDAAVFMLDEFSTVTHSIAIKDAVEELMLAAETGRATDIKVASEQLVRVLEFHKLV